MNRLGHIARNDDRPGPARRLGRRLLGHGSSTRGRATAGNACRDGDCRRDDGTDRLRPCRARHSHGARGHGRRDRCLQEPDRRCIRHARRRRLCRGIQARCHEPDPDDPPTDLGGRPVRQRQQPVDRRGAPPLVARPAGVHRRRDRDRPRPRPRVRDADHGVRYRAVPPGRARHLIPPPHTRRPAMNRLIGIASAILLVGVLAACTATDPRLEDEPLTPGPVQTSIDGTPSTRGERVVDPERRERDPPGRSVGRAAPHLQQHGPGRGPRLDRHGRERRRELRRCTCQRRDRDPEPGRARRCIARLGRYPRDRLQRQRGDGCHRLRSGPGLRPGHAVRLAWPRDRAPAGLHRVCRVCADRRRHPGWPRWASGCAPRAR